MPKKQKKKKPPRQHSRTSPEEDALVEALLADYKDLPPEQTAERAAKPSVAAALIERLPLEAPETPPLLVALSRAFPEKNVQKAIRRTLFKLKQRGGDLPDIPTNASAAPVSRPAGQEEPLSYVGPVDGSGSRPVFVALPQAPKGFFVGIGIVGDEEGIIHFHAGPYSKKRMKELESQIMEETGGAAMIPTSLSHAAAVLEQGYQRSKEKAARVPPDYLSLRPLLQEKAPPLERAAVYDLMTEDEIPAGPLTSSQTEKLFDHELMQSWVVDPDRAKPLIEEMMRVQESPIFLTEAQKLDRIRDLQEKWIEENYPPPQRLRLRQRLEEMAFIFYKREERDYSVLALKAAQSLHEDASLKTDEILLYLLQRSLRWFMGRPPEEAEDRPKSPSSPILAP